MRGLSALCLSAALAACAVPAGELPGAAPEPAANAADSVAVDARQVAQGNRVFALSLYRALAQGEEENIFFSPFSIATAFGPVIAGAAGETRQAIARTLHYPAAGPGLHPALGGLARTLERQSDEATLVIGNALWVKRGFALLPAFEQTARRDYRAEVETLDFEGDRAGSANRINAWVDERTRRRIRRLVEPEAIDDTTRLFVTNVVYFLADWQAQFRAGETANRPFTLQDGSTVQVPMMHQINAFRHHDAGAFTAIDLPYRDPRLMMTVLLPKAADGLPALERALTPELLDRTLEALDGAEPVRLDLLLPKLELRTGYGLAPVLQDMGMAIAFSNRADFSNITTEEPLAIDSVIHKTYLRVDEKGTEAVAATAVEIVATSAPRPPEVRFHADHPFLFLLRDRETGTILFFGRIGRPVIDAG